VGLSRSSVVIDGKRLQEIILFEVTKTGGLFSSSSGAVSTLMEKLVNGKLAPAIRSSAIRSFTQGIDDVGSHLKAGFAGAESGNAEHGWLPLASSYIKRKLAKNKDKFWKNTGRLSSAYSNVSRGYKTALEKTKVSSRVTNAFSFKSLHPRHISKQFEITLELPSHSDDFFTSVFRDSFVNAKAHSGIRGSEEGGDGVFAKIGYLEGQGRTHRPFMAKIMAYKGKRYRDNTQRVIKRAVESSGNIKLS
jgi:hypothetical protein